MKRQRAEEAALKAHPDKVFRYKKIYDTDGVMTGESVKSNQHIGDYFIEGYEQAEKDLALTKEDLELLHTFLYAVKNNKQGCFTFTRLSDEQYQEVLRRFNAKRNEKEI